MVTWSSGVHIVGTPIWCDVVREHEVSFLSGLAPLPWPRRGSKQARVICTAETAQFLRALDRLPSQDVLVSPFGRPILLGRLRLELLPSGRHPGAAQLLVEVKGKKILYAVGVRPESPLTQVRGCDALVLEPSYLRLSPDNLVGWVQKHQPGVIIASLYGELVEVARILKIEGVRLRTPKRSHRLLLESGALQWRGKLDRNEILLWPQEMKNAPKQFPRLDVQTICKPESSLLMQFARSTGACDVYFVGELTREVALLYATAKMRTHPLSPPQQMGLWI